MVKLAEIFKALGDETRLDIVIMLKGKELCVCDIIDAFNLSQPAISHHLKILRQAGIINDTKEGKWVYYRINQNVFQVIKQFVHEFEQYGDKQERCSSCDPD